MSRELISRRGYTALPSVDQLNSIPRNEVARVAFKGIDYIINEKPEAQLSATALLFLAIATRLNADPRLALDRAERLLAARHESYDRSANQWFGALSDFIDHIHDPKRNLGLR